MNCSFQALKTKLSWSFSLGIIFYIHTNGQKHVPCLTRNNSHYIIYARTPVSENLYSRIFYAVISIPESFVRPRGAKTIICIILRYLNEYNTISAPQVAHLMANYI